MTKEEYILRKKRARKEIVSRACEHYKELGLLDRYLEKTIRLYYINSTKLGLKLWGKGVVEYEEDLSDKEYIKDYLINMIEGIDSTLVEAGGDTKEALNMLVFTNKVMTSK